MPREPMAGVHEFRQSRDGVLVRPGRHAKACVCLGVEPHQPGRVPLPVASQNAEQWFQFGAQFVDVRAASHVVDQIEIDGQKDPGLDSTSPTPSFEIPIQVDAELKQRVVMP